MQQLGAFSTPGKCCIALKVGIYINMISLASSSENVVPRCNLITPLQPLTCYRNHELIKKDILEFIRSVASTRGNVSAMLSECTKLIWFFFLTDTLLK